MMAQAMNETKSTDTDKLIAYFEKETEFDILKARKGYFRSWDHQLMQEAYPFTVKPRARRRTSGTCSRSATPCRCQRAAGEASIRPKSRTPAR